MKATTISHKLILVALIVLAGLLVALTTQFVLDTTSGHSGTSVTQLAGGRCHYCT